MAAAAELALKIVADTSGAMKDLDATASKVSKFGGGIKKAAVPAAAALAAVGAAAISAGNAAAEDAQSQAMLALAMEKGAGASKAQIASTEAWISKMSLATGVADDEMRPALSALVKTTGSVATSQDALAAALDISASTGKSVESVTKAITKGYGGSATALSKLVPGMDEAMVKSGDMEAIMAELAKTTGGAAAASAETAAGKMAIMKNQMAEAQESIGALLLPVMAALADILIKVAGVVQDNVIVVAILAGIIATLATAVLLINAAMKVWTAMQIAATAAQWLWNAAMAANPLTIIIIAVIALVAVFVILYKKSETVRDIVNAAWTKIKEGAQAAVDFIKTKWDALWTWLTETVATIKETLGAAWTAVREKVGNVVDGIREKWNTMWTWLTEAATSTKEWLVNAFVWVKEKLIAFAGHISAPYVLLWQTLQSGAGAAKDFVVERFQALKDGLVAIKETIANVFGNLWDGLRNGVSGLGNVLSAPFDTLNSAIGFVIDRIYSLIEWLSKIKVPEINLPSIPNPLGAVLGGVGPGPLGAGPLAAGAAVTGPLTAPSGMSGGFGRGQSITVINVTGAIDPEATARQIDRILKGHDRRMGLQPW